MAAPGTGDARSSPARSRPRRRRPRRRSERRALSRRGTSIRQVTVTGQFGGRNLLGDLPDAPGQEPLRLRAALGRRRHLGDATSAARQGFRAVARRPDRHRPLGRRSAACCSRAAACQWLDATGHARRWSRSRRPRPPIGGARSACRRAAARGRLQRADRRTKPTSRCRRASGFSSRAIIEPGDASRTASACAIDGDAARRRTGHADGGVHDAVPCRRTACWRSASPNRSSAFRTVKVELEEGIIGTDEQPLKPWTLTFQTIWTDSVDRVSLTNLDLAIAILGRAARRSPLAHAVDELVAVVERTAGRLDRRADADADRDRPDEPAAPPHRCPAALNRHRHDRAPAP